MTVIARPLDWQAVFGSEHRHASFHDATLTRLEVDYIARRATFSLRVWVGDPEAEERSMRKLSRTGTLVVTGLLFCALDPPDRRCLYEYPQGLVGLGGLWIADDGEVTEEQPAGAASKLPLPLPSDVFCTTSFSTTGTASSTSLSRSNVSMGSRKRTSGLTRGCSGRPCGRR